MPFDLDYTVKITITEATLNDAVTKAIDVLTNNPETEVVIVSSSSAPDFNVTVQRS